MAAIAPRPSAVAAPNVASGEGTGTDAVAAVTLDEAHAIVTERCTSCHATNPSHAGFSAAPKGVVLETPEQTLAHAAAIHQQTVVTKAMPLGNLTGITDEERDALDRWYRTGPVASVE